MEDFKVLTEDGVELAARHYESDEKKAAILMVHGLCEHQGRYEGHSRFFVDHGYDVFTYDLRGHGISGGERIYAPSPTSFSEDLAVMVNEVRRRFNGKLFLFGHSMGGFTVLQFGALNPGAVEGVMASAALSFNTNGKLTPLAKWMPKDMRIPGKMAGLKAVDLSHDRDVIQAYKDDPLVEKFVTAGLAKNFYEGSKLLQQKVADFIDPLICVHGEDDALVSVEDSKLFVEKCGSEDVTLKTYGGFYHEILNETDNEQVFEDLVEWLNQRTVAM